MNEQEKSQFYLHICRTLEKEPDALSWAIKAIVDGLNIAATQARKERCDWEIIALTAMEKRLFDTNHGFLADKIEAMKSTNSIRWDHTIETLRRKHAARVAAKEKKDD